jgi:opacity protein-like surface antigen
MFLVVAQFPVSAKDVSYDDVCIRKGNVTASVAYGFPSIVRTFLKFKTNRDKIQIFGFGPLMIKADYMLAQRWSVGINFAYNFSRISWMDGGYDPSIQAIRDYEYGIEMEELSASLRGNYHFYQNKKIDAYAGCGFGYGRVTLGTYTEAPLNQWSAGYSIPKPFGVEATVGMRYYPLKNLGFFAEAGLGKSWILFRTVFLPEAIIQAGINLKI